MKNYKFWFFNSNFVSHNAFRLYSYFLWVAEKHPSLKGSNFVTINRDHLAKLMGLSYNSVQVGLKELSTLGMIEIDPEKKKNKDCIRLTSEDEYNKVLLKNKFLNLFFKTKAEDTEASISDVDE